MKKGQSIGRLISCVNRHSQMYLNRELSDWGLASGNHHFLLMLSKEDGIHQKALTDMLRIDKANTARAVEKLINNGYVVKVPDKSDQRAVQIFLTDKGKAIIPELRKVLRGWSDELTAGFSPEEKEEALRLLGRMAENSVKHVRGGE